MLIPVKCLEPILATVFVKAQKSFGCQYYRLIVNVQYVIPILGKPIHKCYHVNDIRLLARKQVKLVISRDLTIPSVKGLEDWYERLYLFLRNWKIILGLYGLILLILVKLIFITCCRLQCGCLKLWIWSLSVTILWSMPQGRWVRLQQCWHLPKN